MTVTAPADPATPDDPPARTTLDREQLEASGVEGTRDLNALAPSLFVSPDGDRKSAFIGIRGLSNAGVGDSSVGLYVDDVPYPDQRGALIDLYDIDRIDVLRGPQTTTFGRNAEAGAISIRTPQPGNDVRGRATIRLGDYDEQTYHVSASGPVVRDRVFLGLAGIKSSHDGYVRNTYLHEDLDGRDLAGGRGRLVVLPFAGAEISLLGDVAHADDGSQSFVLLDQPDPFEVRYDTPGSSTLDTSVGAARLRYETPVATFISVTSRRHFDSTDSTVDLDLSPVPFGVVRDDHFFETWTQEVRASSPRPGARWRWHAGGYFEDKTTEPRLTIALPSLVPPVEDRQEARYRARTWAAFGRAGVTILPGLDLIGGLRIEHFRIAMERTHALKAKGSPAVALAPASDLRQDSLAWLPHARLEWGPMDTVRVYASAARGYRPGGFSHLTDDPIAARFRPSFGWTYEVGARTAWLDERLVAALTLYWARVRDYQNVQRVGLTGFTIRNADRVTSRGIETELAASPWPGLEVAVGAGVIDARYDEFCDFESGRCFHGNTVRLAPDYTVNAAIGYRHPSGFVAEAGCQGIGGYPFFEDNDRGQGPYQLVTARIGWTSTHFGIYLYGRNLADQIYYPFALPPSGPIGYVATPGDPRTVGVMLVAQF